jgi:CheY-like chemotaxis protein
MAKILIVDDDRDSGELIAKMLQLSGHEAAYVPSGSEALARVITDRPDVVLLDLFMPDMDGPSFLEVIHSYLRLKTLPVVVLTGGGDSPMIDRVQRLKVNAVLVKGKATPEDIEVALRQAVSRIPG